MRAVLTMVAVLAVTAALAPAATAQETRTIGVRGDSSVGVPNDQATATITVSQRAQSRSAALRRSSTRTRRVLSALRRAGGDAVDVETLDVSVRRVTVREGNERVRLFQASSRHRVTTTDVARAGDLISAAVAAGATGVSRLRFSRSDVRQVYRDQLVAAFDDARAKAEALAARAGLTLGRPLAIEESGFESSVQQPNAAGGDDAAGPAPVAPPVRPGETTVDARVFVVFEAL